MSRAIEFEKENLALAAGDRTEHPLGLWLRNPAHPHMWAMNQLYVEGRRPDLTAEALAAELDRGLADARHRRAIVTDDATGMALAEGMRAAGYRVTPLMVMLLDAEPPAPPPGMAHEIDERAMQALEERLVVESTHIPEHDRPVVLAGHAHIRATVPGTRVFAGVRKGRDVCQTTLFAHDGIGQPEDVETAASHRGHGIAAATVCLAAREALAAGCETVFILCSAESGPFGLYAGLGFRAAGRFWTFNRQV